MSIPVLPTTNTRTSGLLADGIYTAILYRMVQIGTLEETFKSQKKLVKKVLFSYVIPSVTRLINEQPVPYTVHRLYTESLYETSFLRRDTIKMVGRDFLSELAELGAEYDLTDLLGRVCQLTTRQVTVNQGLTLVEIIDMAPFPEDDLFPDFPLPLQSLSYQDFNWTLFQSLSGRLKAKIESSLEFKKFTPQQIEAGMAAAARLVETHQEDEMDGDLPF